MTLIYWNEFPLTLLTQFVRGGSKTLQKSCKQVQKAAKVLQSIFEAETSHIQKQVKLFVVRILTILSAKVGIKGKILLGHLGLLPLLSD